MSESREEIGFGIGINLGEAVIGNIGVAGRKMEYTVIGDNVNITFRILEQTRIFDRTLIVTKSHFSRVRNLIDAEDLGEIKLKGKKEPVALYAVSA